MHMTQSANYFKIIKETVAALSWGFVSFLSWDMAGSMLHSVYCGALTSLPIWSSPPSTLTGVRVKQGRSGRREESQHIIKQSGNTSEGKLAEMVMRSLSTDIGEITKAQCLFVCALANVCLLFSY